MAWIKPHLTASCMELFCLSPDMPPRFTLAFTTSPHSLAFTTKAASTVSNRYSDHCAIALLVL